MPAVGDGPAKELFRLALVAIEIGRVEQADSEVDRLVHYRLGGSGVEADTEVVAAQSDG